MKIAFVFSGQGSQYIGMGKELYDKFPICRDIYQRADQVLGFNIKDLIFAGEKDELDITENTQPAILATSIAIYQLLNSKGIYADVLAGLSLGEYSALVASGAIDFQEAISLVRKRGKFMQEAVPRGLGKMVAIFGVSLEQLEKITKAASIKGIVEIANVNTDKQIVIAGEVEAVDYAMELCKEAKVRRIVELQVSGPFHTSLLNEASIKLQRELEKVDIRAMKVPVISNVTAKAISNSDDIKELLVKQVKSRVKWKDSIEEIIDLGVDVFIEVGPGRTLSSFIKQINKDVKVYNVENEKSLNSTLEGLGVKLC